MAKSLGERRQEQLAGRPSLKNFTDRERETDVFRRHVASPVGRPLPAVAYYGVGGVGKTWLLGRLAEVLDGLPDSPPHARVDLDRRASHAGRISEPAAALQSIAEQLGVPCPAFTLAYAVLRHRQGLGDLPEFRHGGKLRAAWEFADAATDDLAMIPGANIGKWFASRLAAPVWERLRETPLGRWVETATGGDDLKNLRSERDCEKLHDGLFVRLLSDLEEHLPTREGKACRAVLFLDTYEAVAAGAGSDGEQHRREAWVRDLYAPDSPLLLVVAGRDRLRWAEVDSDFDPGRDPLLLDQHLVGGLSEHDARVLLDRSGVADRPLQDSLLAVSAEVPRGGASAAEVGHHPFSLGLCVDSVAEDRARGVEADPGSFALRPNDTAALAERFLKSLPHRSDEHWLATLALTPRFDADAAKHARSEAAGVARDAAWEHLRRFSFLAELDEPGWFKFHARMQEALRARVARNPESLREGHERWRAYWGERSLGVANAAASAAWYHLWHLRPGEAHLLWTDLVDAAHRELRMADHLELLDWWVAADLERGTPTEEGASALVTLAGELRMTTLGGRTRNLNRAITCCRSALRFYTERDRPEGWAAVQVVLGNLYADGPTDDDDGDERRAINCLESALRVHTERDSPQEWGIVQTNLATIYAERSTGDSTKNLRRSISHGNAALRVFGRVSSPLHWAHVQHNLAVAYQDLESGDVAR